MGASACAAQPLDDLGVPAAPEPPPSALDPGPTGEGAVDAGGDSPSECLIGEWLADNNEMGEFIAGLNAGGDSDVKMSTPTGAVVFTFLPDGTYSVAYDKWTLEATQNGITVETVIEGTDRGEFEVRDDHTLILEDTEIGTEITVNSPGGSFSEAGELSKSTQQFTCDGDVLITTAEGERSVLSRL